MSIKKGDSVKILTGKDSGKTGKVLSVFTKEGHVSRVSIEGINVYKKHTRPRRQGEKGEVVALVRPLQASNVQVVCGSCSRPTRHGYRQEGDIKVRYCKKCNATM